MYMFQLDIEMILLMLLRLQLQLQLLLLLLCLLDNERLEYVELWTHHNRLRPLLKSFCLHQSLSLGAVWCNMTAAAAIAKRIDEQTEWSVSSSEKKTLCYNKSTGLSVCLSVRQSETEN